MMNWALMAFGNRKLQMRFGGVNKKRLNLLGKNLAAVADEKTAYDPVLYGKMKALSAFTGHCNAVAYVVQRVFGGDILQAKVTLELNGETKRDTHYWNRLPEGDEVDLSSGQYGGDGVHALHEVAPKPLQGNGMRLELKEVGKAKVVPQRKSVNKRFLLLWERVQGKIKGLAEKAG